MDDVRLQSVQDRGQTGGLREVVGVDAVPSTVDAPTLKALLDFADDEVLTDSAWSAAQAARARSVRWHQLLPLSSHASPLSRCLSALLLFVAGR